VTSRATPACNAARLLWLLGATVVSGGGPAHSLARAGGARARGGADRARHGSSRRGANIGDAAVQIQLAANDGRSHAHRAAPTPSPPSSTVPRLGVLADPASRSSPCGSQGQAIAAGGWRRLVTNVSTRSIAAGFAAIGSAELDESLPARALGLRVAKARLHTLGRRPASAEQLSYAPRGRRAPARARSSVSGGLRELRSPRLGRAR